MENTVTIAIPVYNRARYFRDALESALSQTLSVSVLVVDNCSPDIDFRGIVESYDDRRIQYHRNERNVGMIENWNQCLRLSKTPWVSILHDDDFLFRNAIESLWMATERWAGKALYFGCEVTADAETAYAPFLARLPGEAVIVSPAQFAAANQFAAAGNLIQRRTALDMGGFQSKYKMTADWDLWFRLALHSDGAIKLLNEIAAYRSYEDQGRGTTAMVRSGRQIPALVNQARRNLGRLRSSVTRGDALDMRRKFASGAVGELCRNGCAMTERAARVYRAYARLVPPTDPWKKSVYKLSPMAVAWVAYLYSWVRPWKRRLFHEGNQPVRRG